MASITSEQIAAACAIASDFSDGKIKLTEGARILSDHHGLNENSARDFMNDYWFMVRGKSFKRTMSAPAFDHFLAQISEVRGRDVLINAVKAVDEHLAYYEEIRKTSMHEVRNVLAKYRVASAATSGAAMDVVPFDSLKLLRTPLRPLLEQAGLDHNYIKDSRNFTSKWIWTDGATTVATIWKDEVHGVGGSEYLEYPPPQQRDNLLGQRLFKAQEHYDRLHALQGGEVRAVIQTRITGSEVPGAAVAAGRVLDPVIWTVSVSNDLVRLTRGDRTIWSASENHADAGWSDEELWESVTAYIDMQAKLDAGQPLIKQSYYRALSTKFGRTSGAYEFRMQNISYVLSLLGRRWIPGLVPKNNVGAKNAAKLEVMLAEIMEMPISHIAEFEARVQAAMSSSVSNGPPKGSSMPVRGQKTVVDYARNAEVKGWILKQANGVCECCGQPAPFMGSNGPFLEVHHVVRLADNGADCVENAIAVCPNCHRRLHYAIDAAETLEQLYKRVDRLVRAAASRSHQP